MAESENKPATKTTKTSTTKQRSRSAAKATTAEKVADPKPATGETAGDASTANTGASGAVENQNPETPQSASQPTAPAPEEAATEEVVALQPEFKTPSSPLSDKGKDFYSENQFVTNALDGAVEINYVGGVPVAVYTAEAIHQFYFKDFEHGARYGMRLNEFIVKSLSVKEFDRKQALNQFLLLVTESERLPADQFKGFYDAFTQFIGDDVKSNGFFGSEELMSALRLNASAGAFAKALKKLVPSKDRSKNAAEMNYALAQKVFTSEQVQQMFTTMYQ